MTYLDLFFEIYNYKTHLKVQCEFYNTVSIKVTFNIKKQIFEDKMANVKASKFLEQFSL